MNRKHDWNDEWILDNYKQYCTWADMVKDYNRLFDTSLSREQFKNHIQKLNIKLAVPYSYTEDMDEFIIAHYPHLTSSELENLFNKTFHTRKSYKAIRQRAFKLNVTKSSEYITERQRKAGCARRVPVGTITTDRTGLDRIKVAEGRWVTYARYLYEQEHGELPEGYAVMFLDGDNTNTSLDNLIARPEGYNALLTQKLQIERSCPELTRTAILWCDLYSTLTKETD